MVPALLDHQLTVPDEATANQAAEAVDILERFLRQHPDLPGVAVSLTADDFDTTLQIPGHALRLLVDILAQIANGNAVTVAPVHARAHHPASCRHPERLPAVPCQAPRRPQAPLPPSRQQASRTPRRSPRLQADR